jgi:Lon-like ATP-dependent protease
MLAQALSEILPVQRLEDVLIYPNNLDPNVPLVRVQKAGTARKMLDRMRMDSMAEEDTARTTGLILSFAWFVFAYLIWSWRWISDIIYAALLIVGTVLLLGVSLGSQMRPRTGRQIPKLLVDNLGKKTAPFVEATGARAGALLGDVRHDPLQSGGLGTPPHLRVEPGMIHRANGGVLFLDEIATLSARAQQELLTVMQEKKYSITGQSENSSGAMTRTEPVPADFVLVAAGNYQDLEKVHPALRSRIRGYGYEVYMNNDMPDNEENVKKICQFVAQEVKKDGKIPHFSFDATQEIVFEARRRAGRKNRLTLKLRDLGGLIRAAGDLAKAKAHLLVLPEDVFEAKMSARTLEQQMVGKLLDHRKDYDIFLNKGANVRRANLP